MRLTVHLTEGFAGETVRLSAGNAEATAEDVRSDTLTGLARTVALDVEGPGTLRVETGGRCAEAEVDPAAVAFVTAQLSGEDLVVTPVTREAYAKEPRGFA